MNVDTDEISELANQFTGPYIGNAFELIESQICAATGSGRWDDAQKWHQVKFRLKRMQMEEACAERLAPMHGRPAMVIEPLSMRR